MGGQGPRSPPRRDGVLPRYRATGRATGGAARREAFLTLHPIFFLLFCKVQLGPTRFQFSWARRIIQYKPTWHARKPDPFRWVWRGSAWRSLVHAKREAGESVRVR